MSLTTFDDAGRSVLETAQAAAGGTGNGTAIDVKGFKTLVLDVTGTFVGTVTFEATIDDTNWVAIGLAAIGTGTLATTATAPGMFVLSSNSFAFSQIRARVSAWTSGTITVKTRKHLR